MNTRSLLFWLGSEAKAIADEYETQRQLERELPMVDATEEEG
jgi:hypothetical protein